MSAILAQTSGGGSGCCPSTISVDVDSNIPAISGFVAIDPATTEIVDSIPVSDYRGTKWLVSIINPTTNNRKSFEVFAVHQDGTSPFFTLYSTLSTGLAFILDVIISAGNLELTVQNNELNAVIAYITRLPIPRVLNPAVPTPVNFAPITAKTINFTIGAGDTETIDSSTVQFTKANKWFLTLANLNAAEIESLELFGMQGLGAIQTTATMYANVGDIGVNADIDLVLVGSSAELQITNNEIDDIVVTGTRIPVTIDHLLPTLLPQTTCIPNPCAIEPECSIVLTSGFGIIIDPGDTEIIDTVNYIGYNQVKWLITASNDTLNVTRGVQINASMHNGNPSFSQYSDIATLLDIDIDVVVAGINVNLQITNNEAFPIAIDFCRLPVSI